MPLPKRSQESSLKRLKARARQVLPQVLHIEFESHQKMLRAFMRVREYFESPELKGKSLPRRTYQKWLEQLGVSKHQYLNDWAAFNMPLSILLDFFEEHDDRSSEEEQLYQFAKTLKEVSYLIATFGSDRYHTNYLRHEIAHALYATDPVYRRSVKRLLQPLHLGPIFQWLSEQQYHRNRWVDEAHAYLLDGSQSLKQDLGVDPKAYRKVIPQLKRLFKKHLRKIQNLKSA